VFEEKRRKMNMFHAMKHLVSMCAAVSSFAVLAACVEEADAIPDAGAQPAAPETRAELDPSASESPERLVQIAVLESPEANDEFTRNVEIMQARVRAVANLNNAIAAEPDPIARDDIQIELEEILRTLNEDNRRMAEAYRYSLTRRYMRNIEKATVFLVLTDEEVDRIVAEADAQGAEVPVSVSSNMLSICTLNTPEAAQGFQRDVATVQNLRDMALQMQTTVDAAENPEDAAYARGRLDQVFEQLNALNKAMVVSYGFSISRNYVLQIDKSTLYVWATEDELTEAAQAE
jgi:hypothetical protein